MFFRPPLIVAFALGCLSPALWADDEWEPYRRTGLFPESMAGAGGAGGSGAKWIVPDTKKESVAQFTARLMDGARGGDPKAMATLGRFFFVRGDAARAGEWLKRAALAGHTAAQLDYGQLRSTGNDLALAEAYQWLWLATWSREPGAEDALRRLEPKLQAWHIVAGVKWAAEFQASQSAGAPTTGSPAQRLTPPGGQ